jgi:glutathione S-transferase
MLQLYDTEISGNCYKVRLLLSLLGQHYERVAVDLRRGDQRQEAFLRLNPKGQVPVLRDGETIIADSQAILVYLGGRFGGGRWYPQDPEGQARVQFWLSTAANEVQNGIATTRGIRLFGYALDYGAARKKAFDLLALLDDHLAGREWLANAWPTIADVAVYPYIALAPDGDVSLAGYANVQAWLERTEALPAYIRLPQAPAAS